MTNLAASTVRPALALVARPALTNLAEVPNNAPCPAARALVAAGLPGCAVCADPIVNCRPGQLYCGEVCRDYANVREKARTLIHTILDAAPTNSRPRAVYALRAAVMACATGEDLPGPGVKLDRAGAAQARDRRRCACCRAELPQQTGRGRRRVVCAVVVPVVPVVPGPATSAGRKARPAPAAKRTKRAAKSPCAVLRNRLTDLHNLRGEVVAVALARNEAAAERALAELLVDAREIAAEIT